MPSRKATGRRGRTTATRLDSCTSPGMDRRGRGRATSGSVACAPTMPHVSPSTLISAARPSRPAIAMVPATRAEARVAAADEESGAEDGGREEEDRERSRAGVRSPSGIAWSAISGAWSSSFPRANSSGPERCRSAEAPGRCTSAAAVARRSRPASGEMSHVANVEPGTDVDQRDGGTGATVRDAPRARRRA